MTVSELQIDIPVKMTNVKMVFSIPALSFEGDLPAAIFHMQLITNDVAVLNRTGSIWWKSEVNLSFFLRKSGIRDYRSISHECRPRDIA